LFEDKEWEECLFSVVFIFLFLKLFESLEERSSIIKLMKELKIEGGRVHPAHIVQELMKTLRINEGG
jgi:hypothetical protein